MNNNQTQPVEPSSPVVEANGISKRFGSTQALLDIGVTLQAGRCLGLVGRNGAGKSTLVSILCGLLAPDAGEIRFGGEPAPPLADVPAWRSRMATVFQHSTVVPAAHRRRERLSGRPSSAQGHRQLARDARSDAPDPRRMGFRHRSLASNASRLTVEQRQIVEIAGALARGTRILLLDEPTAALERGGARRLFERVRALTAGGSRRSLHLAPPRRGIRDLRRRRRPPRRPRRPHSADTRSLTEDGL